MEAINFPETYASNFVNALKDGFKMLRTNPFYWNEMEQFWVEFNLPWLEGLKNSGADVVVLSDKSNDLLKFRWTKNKTTGEINFTKNNITGERILTGFGSEIKYLEDLVSQGIYQWYEINGVFKFIGN
jgi:hypothetical protein